MKKPNRDPDVERTKALAAAAAAMEVVASLAPPPLDAGNQIALELDQQLAQELDPIVPQTATARSSPAQESDPVVPQAAPTTARSSGNKRKAATARLNKAKRQRKH